MFPTPLTTVDWLSKNLSIPDLVIFDATIPKVGQAELSNEALTLSIPGARHFDLKAVFQNKDAPFPNTMPAPESFAQQVRKLGVNQTSKIVVYDHHGVYSSPRAWWMFKAMGHFDVAVLDGGFLAWKAAGMVTGPTEIFTGPHGDFVANYQPKLIVSSQEVLQSLENTNTAVLDARSADRFSGTIPEPRTNLRSGHIPSSQNLPYKKILDDAKMQSKESLNEVFSKLNIEGKRVILSCGSGITACVLALGAELAGHTNQAVFDGSWSEWGDGDELPVEKKFETRDFKTASITHRQYPNRDLAPSLAASPDEVSHDARASSAP